MNLNQRSKVVMDPKLIWAVQKDLFLTWMYDLETEIFWKKMVMRNKIYKFFINFTSINFFKGFGLCVAFLLFSFSEDLIFFYN